MDLFWKRGRVGWKVWCLGSNQVLGVALGLWILGNTCIKPFVQIMCVVILVNKLLNCEKMIVEFIGCSWERGMWEGNHPRKVWVWGIGSRLLPSLTSMLLGMLISLSFLSNQIILIFFFNIFFSDQLISSLPTIYKYIFIVIFNSFPNINSNHFLF